MKRALCSVVLLGATLASAEGGWLTARGRLQPDLRLEAWAGSRTAGLGVVFPDAPGAMAGIGAEVVYAFFDRTHELRGARVWQLTKNRFATASTTPTCAFSTRSTRPVQAAQVMPSTLRLIFAASLSIGILL